MLDCPKQDGTGASARAQLSVSASDGGYSGTGCVLTEPSGQRSFPLDDVLSGSGGTSHESSPHAHAQAHRGEPHPVSATDHSICSASLRSHGPF